MVLRRSTTRWTRPSDFNNAARSTVTFISQPVPLGGNQPRTRDGGGQRPQRAVQPCGGSKGGALGPNRQGRRRAPPPFSRRFNDKVSTPRPRRPSSVLQLPF